MTHAIRSASRSDDERSDQHWQGWKLLSGVDWLRNSEATSGKVKQDEKLTERVVKR